MKHPRAVDLGADHVSSSFCRARSERLLLFAVTVPRPCRSHRERSHVAVRSGCSTRATSPVIGWVTVVPQTRS